MVKSSFLVGLVGSLCSALVLMIGPALAIDANNTSAKLEVAQRTKPKPETGSKSGVPTELDPQAEKSALALVSNHLSQLEPMLKRLQREDLPQYRRAIMDLSRSARRIEAAENRDVRLFEIEVELLQAQTGVDLMTARLKVRDNESDRARLQKATQRLSLAQLARSKYEVKSLQSRLERTQQMLEMAQQRLQDKQREIDENSDRAYLLSLRKAGRQPDGVPPKRDSTNPPNPTTPN